MFWNATQPVYDRYLGQGGVPLEVEVDRIATEIDDSPEFELRTDEALPWSQWYDREQYLRLLSTYSPHRLMPARQRAAFFDEIGSIIDSMGGRIERRYETRLLLGQRL